MSLSDGLEWLGRPGAAVRNIAAGRPGAALRQLGQFAVDPLDAIIPGDNFHIADQQDEMSGRDLLDQYGILDKKSEGIMPAVGGIVAEMATDPLTYLGGGLISKGAKGALGLAKTGVEALPAELSQPILKTARQTGDFAADTFGWDRMTPKQRQAVHETAAVSGQSNAAMEPELQRILAGSTVEDRRAAAEIIDNIVTDPTTKKAAVLDPYRNVGWDDFNVQKNDVLASVSTHPLVHSGAADPAKVSGLVENALNLSRNEWEEGLASNVFTTPGIKGGAALPPGHSPGAYLQRIMAQDAAGTVNGLPGSPNAMKARTLKTPDELVDYLNRDPANLEGFSLDLGERLAQRGQQQGRILQRAEAMKRVVGPNATLASDADRAAMNARLEKLATHDNPALRDYGVQMKTLWEGMGPRGNAQEILATANRIFKKPATMGVVIPNAAYFVRNRLGGAFQALTGATQGEGIVKGLTDQGVLNAANPVNVIKDLFAGITHGVAAIVPDAVKSPQLTDEIGQTLDAISDAYKAAGGRRDVALANLAKTNPMAHELVSKGIIDGNMLSADDLVAKLKLPPDTGIKGVFGRMWDAPAEANRALEDRMRGGYYLALRKTLPPDQAARRAIEDLVDYRSKTSANRLFRDIVPFGAFAAGTLPKIAGSGPTLALGNALMGHGEDDPIYPYMEGKANIPLGLDEKGNAQYMTSLGLPVESIGQMEPSLSNLFSQANPLLKTGYMMLSGEDPYFKTPYGSYDKMPFAAQALGLVGEDRSGGELGAVINKVRGSGITMPLESALGLRQVDPWLDPRNSTLDALLKTTTGAKITSVDPDLAQRQQVEQWLKEHPREVKSYETFYTNEHSPELDAMLEKFKEAKARLKEKRDAAKVNGIQ